MPSSRTIARSGPASSSSMLSGTKAPSSRRPWASVVRGGMYGVRCAGSPRSCRPAGHVAGRSGDAAPASPLARQLESAAARCRCCTVSPFCVARERRGGRAHPRRCRRSRAGTRALVPSRRVSWKLSASPSPEAPCTAPPSAGKVEQQPLDRVVRPVAERLGLQRHIRGHRGAGAHCAGSVSAPARQRHPARHQRRVGVGGRRVEQVDVRRRAARCGRAGRWPGSPRPTAGRAAASGLGLTANSPAKAIQSI